MLKRIFLLFCLLPCFVYADSWTGKEKVTVIYAGYSGFILFETTGAIINPASCPDATKYAYEGSEGEINRVLSVLLAAQKSGSLIKVAESSSQCGTGGVAFLSGKVVASRIAAY
ncbi:hypothetical protein [Agaribacterium sp. ZY112]|uniref:hypothetical protein n=1 Tax=Agaribacterium sp. ZY112 TaxID=3233574 RepID=UPI0035258DA9